MRQCGDAATRRCCDAATLRCCDAAMPVLAASAASRPAQPASPASQVSHRSIAASPAPHRTARTAPHRTAPHLGALPPGPAMPGPASSAQHLTSGRCTGDARHGTVARASRGHARAALAGRPDAHLGGGRIEALCVAGGGEGVGRRGVASRRRARRRAPCFGRVRPGASSPPARRRRPSAHSRPRALARPHAAPHGDAMRSGSRRRGASGLWPLWPLGLRTVGPRCSSDHSPGPVQQLGATALLRARRVCVDCAAECRRPARARSLSSKPAGGGRKFVCSLAAGCCCWLLACWPVGLLGAALRPSSRRRRRRRRRLQLLSFSRASAAGAIRGGGPPPGPGHARAATARAPPGRQIYDSPRSVSAAACALIGAARPSACAPHLLPPATWALPAALHVSCAFSRCQAPV